MPARGGIVEFFSPGDHITVTAGGTITGGQIVAYSANRTVVTAGAASMLVAGVALHDAVSGEKLTIATDGVWPLKATGAISFGDRSSPPPPAQSLRRCRTGRALGHRPRAWSRSRTPQPDA